MEEQTIRRGNPEVFERPEVGIVDAHNAIKTYLRSKFSGFTVESYSRPGHKIPTPAIYLELDSFEANADEGTEQLPVTLTWSAEIICSYKDGQKLNVRVEAARLALALNGQRFGLPMSPARVTSGLPESFELGTTGRENLTTEYESWRVSWTNQCYLGQSVWDYSEIIPTTVFSSDAPRLGAGYPDDYQKGNRHE